MISLGAVRGRDNNFNLIRFIAAYAVLVVHGLALIKVDPNNALVGIKNFNAAAAALDVFFFTSGFLVTGSLFGRANIIDFAWARVMRIFPALWVMLLVTTTALGLFVGALSAHDFFASPVTHEYVMRGATLVNGVKFELPGVFQNNPASSEVNRSLWTLPIEWRLYEYLAAAWVILALRPQWRARAFRYATPAVALALTVAALRYFYLHGQREVALVPQAMFFYGAAMQLWRDRIKLSILRLLVLLGALGLATVNKDVFHPVYMAVLGPVTLHFAYLFGGPIRAYNRIGDYSYGVYIYAFPIQQTLVAFIPGLTAVQMTLYASALALLCAVLSWHLLERPALDWKLVPAAASQRLFERLEVSLSRLARRRAA
jgi:peptidoglycan/LPS O-acetylase OafA/YrhL